MNELIATRYQFNRLADIIGRGGMGTVYRGFDNQTQLTVAVKQLLPELVSLYPDALKRFMREAKVLKDLQHPNIIPIIEAVSDIELGHYIVMGYIDGGTLWDEMQAHPYMPVHRVLDLAQHLASALVLVHQNNLIHRDIKPANVLIHTDKTPVLSDFGVVHLQSETQITEVGSLVGTLDYLSPEMLNGEAITTKADIWAFGVMLYEMVTGKRPFVGDNPSALITAVLTKPIIDPITLRPDMPPSLGKLLEWMLVKDPVQRVGTMELVLQALQDISIGQTTLSIPNVQQIQFKRIGSLPKVFGEAPFYNREGHIASLNNFIVEGKPFIGVYGRGGIGKTALVCKAMGDAEKNGAVQGMAYLRANSTPPLNSDGLLATLSEFLSPEHPFHDTRKSAGISMTDKTHALLEALSGGRYLVYVDNLETLQNPDTHVLIDDGLTDFFSVLLQTNTETLCVITTTRYPLPFPNAIKAYERAVRLDEGLPTQDALAFLREMDKQQVLPKDDAQLYEWINKVGGYPRGLEALVGYLNGGETRYIDDLLEDSTLFEGEVLANVVEQVHKALPQDFRWVMTGVAVIGQATTRAELEYLLAPYLETARARFILERLVEGRFLIYNRQTRTYSLHPLDQTYALSSTPTGSSTDEPSAFTRYILNDRMAIYYHGRRKPQPEWSSLADLEPVLREFEHHYANAKYEDAAQVLFEIDAKYLMLWGHAPLMFNLHGRLQGKLTNRPMMMQSAGNLGSACWMMGNMKGARGYYEQALALSREIEDKAGESRWVGNLGNVAYVMGNIEQAIPYYTQALDLARQIQDRKLMGTWLNNLSNIYYQSGQIEKMVISLEESVVLSREAGNQSAETISLGNLGNAYMNLGRNDEAITYYQKALSLSRQLQHRPNETVNLANLANLYITIGRYDEAFDLLTLGIEIANQIHDVRVLQAMLLYQARNYWYRNNLPDALNVIQEAGKYDIGDNNHAVAITNGVILLLMGRPTEATPLLETGLKLVDDILEQSPKLYEGHFTRGTTYLALWLITGQQSQYEQVKTAYQTALSICDAKGIRNNNWEEAKRLLAYGQKDSTELATLFRAHEF